MHTQTQGQSDTKSEQDNARQREGHGQVGVLLEGARLGVEAHSGSGEVSAITE